MQRIGVAGSRGQDLAIDSLGVGQPSGLVVSDGGCQCLREGDFGHGRTTHTRHHCRQTSRSRTSSWRANRRHHRGASGPSGRAAPRGDRRGGQVPCDSHGPFNVIAGIRGHGLGQSDVRQVAQRVPAGEGLSGAGHDGHAHPEGLAARHTPRVRKRIERQVDRIVSGQEVAPRASAAKLQLRRIGAGRGERGTEPLPEPTLSRAGATSNNRDPGRRERSRPTTRRPRV